MSVRPEFAPYTIITSKTFDKQLGKLSSANAIRILNSLEALGLTAVGDIVNVGAHLPGAFRLRVGDLRVYFDVEDQTIVVNMLEKRGEAYKRKSRNR